MPINTNDCADELVSTEHLSTFSVVELFCDQCGDLTPHHIDDYEKRSTLKSADASLVSPLSAHECVICREEKEGMLDEFTQYKKD